MPFETKRMLDEKSFMTRRSVELVETEDGVELRRHKLYRGIGPVSTKTLSFKLDEVESVIEMLNEYRSYHLGM